MSDRDDIAATIRLWQSLGLSSGDVWEAMGRNRRRKPGWWDVQEAMVRWGRGL